MKAVQAHVTGNKENIYIDPCTNTAFIDPTKASEAGDRHRLQDSTADERPQPVQPIRDGDQPRRDRATPRPRPSKGQSYSQFPQRNH